MDKKQPRVVLDPMTEAEFGPYLDAAVQKFAREKTISGEWSEQEAAALSAQDHARLLPDGLKTPDQHLYTVRDAGSGQPVATLWLMLRPKADRIECWIYDIEVRKLLRGRGYGRATMLAAIAKAREFGADSVGLHVFGHNVPAHTLYSSLGFVATNISMSLDL